MRLYNSLSRRIEPLAPQADPLRLYACGITPYDTTHLGHAFTYASVDILVRYLELRGRRVRYVQNVTDVDDDLLQAAEKAGENWRELSNRWTRHFIDDMRALNVRPPDSLPRATDVIDSIVHAVDRLLQAGVAYHKHGSVYFDIEAWPEFGKLSGLDRASMLPIANERGNHPDDPNKRDSLDFVLWQAQAEGEPGWPSPWGVGRPGWHIECSTIIEQMLGDQIDVHAGGSDLQFPHHDCEIAQVEGGGGQAPFVRHWLHVAMVGHEGEKMSKSIGNLVMISDLLRLWPAAAIRLYLAGFHYRTSWEHDAQILRAAADRLSRWQAAMHAPASGDRARERSQTRAEFYQAMDQDLDSPAALQVLDQLVQSIEAEEAAGRAEDQRLLAELASVFGVQLSGKGTARADDVWQRHRQRFEQSGNSEKGHD